MKTADGKIFPHNSKDFVVQNHTAHLVVSQYDNGDIRLHLYPWAIEITRTHPGFSVEGNCWIIKYKNFPFLAALLEQAGLIKVTNVFANARGVRLQLCQYLL